MYKKLLITLLSLFTYGQIQCSRNLAYSTAETAIVLATIGLCTNIPLSKKMAAGTFAACYGAHLLYDKIEQEKNITEHNIRQQQFRLNKLIKYDELYPHRVPVAAQNARTLCLALSEVESNLSDNLGYSNIINLYYFLRQKSAIQHHLLNAQTLTNLYDNHIQMALIRPVRDVAREELLLVNYDLDQLELNLPLPVPLTQPLQNTHYWENAVRFGKNFMSAGGWTCAILGVLGKKENKKLTAATFAILLAAQVGAEAMDSKIDQGKQTLWSIRSELASVNALIVYSQLYPNHIPEAAHNAQRLQQILTGFEQQLNTPSTLQNLYSFLKNQALIEQHVSDSQTLTHFYENEIHIARVSAQIDQEEARVLHLNEDVENREDLISFPDEGIVR